MILSFPLAIASGSNIPIFLEVREITIGNFIQRTDAFFVIIWLLTILSYLSIIMAFTLLIFKKITNIQNQEAVSNCIFAILFATALSYNNILQIRFLIFIFGFNISILFFANIKQHLIKKKKGELNNNEI